MAQVTIEIVSKKAETLGFRFSMISAGRYRMLHPGTSYGYNGNLDGCLAYLQGWEENAKFNSYRW